MTVEGSDPAQLVRALTRYGLHVTERRGMTDHELRALLELGRPVILMLQAWGARTTYRHHWADGHWVVAIGHDRGGLYVMDPQLPGARGFLAWRELGARWHDIEGRARQHVFRYGLAVSGRRAPRLVRVRAVRRLA
jgi:predicted double-glycine peptidase